MIKAKVIGAGGYGGIGITELLLGHPQAQIGALVSVDQVGTPISEIYPHLAGFCDLPILEASDPRALVPFDVVFMATPDGVGMNLAAAEIAKGARVIDYSGDFRFNTTDSYAEYARRIGRDTTHTAPDLLQKAVYGLTELHRNEIGAQTRIVGNPGCFAVSCILGLAPAVQAGLVALDSLICDCKTGVSGAGKKPNPMFHYPARYDHMNAYKLAGHQHVCEIERELGRLAGQAVTITFTAQVVPLCRGIMSTLYASLNQPMDEAAVRRIYEEFYAQDRFVRIYGSTATVGTAHVRGTNYNNLVVSVDARAQRLRVVSYIDNLMKGQAGSALQNMNVLFGFDESAGLDRPGFYP